jgi:hypothetical protein
MLPVANLHAQNAPEDRSYTPVLQARLRKALRSVWWRRPSEQAARPAASRLVLRSPQGFLRFLQ